MKGTGLLITLLSLSIACFSQSLQFSRPFPVVPKSRPLRLLAGEGEYFYLLRHNRKAHDLTVEKRAASNAEILSFTALRLDSVNSKYFNYENLDYLLFEYRKQLYVVFERELNNSKTLFCKRIDSLGKTGPFTELVNMHRQKLWQDFSLSFMQLDSCHLLVESAIVFTNQSVKKNILCIDLANNRVVWSRQLPIENPATGYSTCFRVDNNTLYYVQVHSVINGYIRRYDRQRQLLLPRLFYDSLHLVRMPLRGEGLFKTPIISGLHRLHALDMDPAPDGIYLFAHVSYADKKEKEHLPGMYTAVFVTGNGVLIKEELTLLTEAQQRRLRYYDGTDSELPGDKDFSTLASFNGPKVKYLVTERKEGIAYKELLVWQWDKEAQKITNVYLIPRRFLSSETWSKYPKIGEAIGHFDGKELQLFMADPPNNADLDPNASTYYQLKKCSNLRGCDLLQMRLQENSHIRIERLYRNDDFILLPLTFQAPYKSRAQMVFYLTSGKQEKYGFFKP